jgi:2-polyprenyl-3-methyl-5-hydroxy-6-metoxy-1,4-benzoquinol methylase
MTLRGLRRLRQSSMRYELKGLVIRTENAAKPATQPSQWVLEQLKQLQKNITALDYGCGKFRYTIPLSRAAKSVAAVDSDVQINRIQQVGGKRTSLREYARNHLKNVGVHRINCKIWQRRKYDFVICINVLSAIPTSAARQQVLKRIRTVLKPGGIVLVTTQFRNTHFNHWCVNPCATRIRDGWLVQGTRGASFYGILPPQKLKRYCEDAGLAVKQFGSHGEMAFVFATQNGEHNRCA